MGKVVSFLMGYWYLFYFYMVLRRKGLPKVVEKIEGDKDAYLKRKRLSYESITTGFQLACRMHFLNVECLERSVALFQLLSSNGYESRLCVGVKQKPFLSHAWIETNIPELDESQYREKFHVFLSVYRGGIG